MAKKLIIWTVSIITIASIILLFGVVWPDLSEVSSRYRFSSVKEAKSWGHIEDAEIIDEIGDTNGPYRLVGGIVSGLGKPFDFDLECRDKKIKWSQPGSNHTWFVVSLFMNRRGNHFAVIRKRTEREMSNGQQGAEGDGSKRAAP